MRSLSIKILIFAFVIPHLTAFREQFETSGVNYRKKSGNRKNQPPQETTSTTESFYNKNQDWTRNPECYVEDSTEGCRQLENGSTCFGASIPFSYSSAAHMKALQWRPPISDHMDRYGVFAGLPECWRSLRELLCYTFFPPCQNGKVFRPPKALCTEAKRNCPFLVEHALWPSALGDCNESTSEALKTVFAKHCNAPRNLIIWSQNSSCMYPLVRSENDEGRMVDKCSLSCTAFRIDRLEPIQNLLLIGLIGIFVFTLVITVLLYKEDKDKVARRPYFWPLFWFLICQLSLTACFLIQMISDANTVCRVDGSLRSREPTRRAPFHAGMWCLLQFITVSGSIVASSLWIMAFACLHFLSKHSPDKCKFWTPYHCVVCVVVLTVVAAALITVHVNGDPVLGICFVTRSSWHALWHVVPIFIACSVTFVLFVMCARVVLNKQKAPEADAQSINHGTNAPSLFQVGVLLILLIALYLTSVTLIIVDVLYAGKLTQKILDYVICKLRYHSDDKSCQIQNDHDVRLSQLQVLLMASPALVVDIWLLICAGYGKRLVKIYKKFRNKPTTLATNGNVVMMTEMTALPSDEQPNGQPNNDQAVCAAPGRTGRYLANRRSWSSSTSSFTDQGVVSEPECRTSKQKEFIQRFALVHGKGNKWRSRSSNSVALSRTPSSLKSQVLPPEVVTSQNSLPFHDLSRYPMIPAAAAQGGWWPPYGWPYPISPYFYYCPQPSSSASTVPANAVWPPHQSSATTSPEQQRALTSDGAGTSNAQASAQQSDKDGGTSQPSRGPESATPMVPAGIAPYFCPYPYPPYPPYWPPPPPVFATTPPQNQVSIQPLASPSTAASPEPSKTTAEKNGETAPNEDTSKKEPEETANEEARDDGKESSESEEDMEEDDDDEVDSEKTDPEEEKFIEEQTKLILGKSEECK